MNRSTLERLTGQSVKKVDYKTYMMAGYVAVNRDPGKAMDDLQSQFWVDRRFSVFERDRFQCVLCGSSSNLECDHIVNRSQGGTHDMDNLQTLCHACHVNKTENRDG